MDVFSSQSIFTCPPLLVCSITSILSSEELKLVPERQEIFVACIAYLCWCFLSVEPPAITDDARTASFIAKHPAHHRINSSGQRCLMGKAWHVYF